MPEDRKASEHPKKSDKPPVMLNKSEAAAALNLGYNSVIDLMNRGELPFTRKGRRVFFNKKDIKAYLSHRSRKSVIPQGYARVSDIEKLLPLNYHQIMALSYSRKIRRRKINGIVYLDQAAVLDAYEAKPPAVKTAGKKTPVGPDGTPNPIRSPGEVTSLAFKSFLAGKSLVDVIVNLSITAEYGEQLWASFVKIRKSMEITSSAVIALQGYLPSWDEEPPTDKGLVQAVQTMAIELREMHEKFRSLPEAAGPGRASPQSPRPTPGPPARMDPPRSKEPPEDPPDELPEAFRRALADIDKE